MAAGVSIHQGVKLCTVITIIISINIITTIVVSIIIVINIITTIVTTIVIIAINIVAVIVICLSASVAEIMSSGREKYRYFNPAFRNTCTYMHSPP